MRFSQKGVTLLETLIAVGVFAFASVVVFAFVTDGFKIQSFALDQSTAMSEARRGVETMVREIRESQVADNGAYTIVTANPQEFSFYSDIDKDSSVERIRYFLEGTDFKRGVIEPRDNPVSYLQQDEVVTVITRFVRNGSAPIFTYYNGDWPGDTVNNPLSDPVDLSEVRFLHVSMTINVRPNVAPTDFNLETDVQMRNLKDNL